MINKLAKILKEIEELQNPRWLIKLINEFRRQVVMTIIENEEYIYRNREKLKAMIDEIITHYEQRLKYELTENDKRLFWRAIKVIDEIIEGYGIKRALPFVDDTIINELAEYRAELITKITNEARNKIKIEITQIALGLKDTRSAINEIGRNLKDKSIFKSILDRAEVIQRTETNRIYAYATWKRIEQWGQILGDKLYKQWIHSHLGVPRQSHLALDGKIIKWNEYFEIHNKKRGIIKTLHPYAPNLPPEEVVNCRCIIIPIIKNEQKE